MGMMVDLGVNTQWRDARLNLGLALQNLGVPPKVGDYPGQGQSPFTTRLQASQDLGAGLDLAQELRVVAPLGDSSFSYCELQAGLGLRYLLTLQNVSVALRAGYDTAFVDSLGPWAGLGLGFGVTLGDFRLDYAYQSLDALGHAHRLGLNWSPGGQQQGSTVYQAYSPPPPKKWRQGQVRHNLSDFQSLPELPPSPQKRGDAWDEVEDDYDY